VLGFALLGLVLLLVRAVPELVSAAQYPQSGFAGLVSMLILVWFILPLAGFLVGGLCLAGGYLLRRVATRPASPRFSSADVPIAQASESDDQLGVR
jgi:hypothetical protein